MPPVAAWQPWYAELEQARRAAGVVAGERKLWVATERARVAETLYPGCRLAPDVPDVEQPVPDSREAAATEVLRGWLESSGPQRPGVLAERLALPPALAGAALARLEGEGQILRGRFSPAGDAAGGETEWCNRRVLARIHRLTLGRLRREIEPVSAADFVRFLARWQHVEPGTRLHGTAGLLQVIRQLQGYEISAAAWEPDVLARRVAGYDPQLLDRLCLSGEVTWGRLSPHPAFEAEAAAPDGEALDGRPRRRVRPTRAAPVAIFLREDAPWLAPRRCAGESGSPALSHAARAVLEQLEAHGASFLRELVRASGRLPSEVEDGLWELVAAGLVTADGFDNLRALIDPKRRRGEGRFRTARPRHAAGRWALLRTQAPGAADGGGAAVEQFARQLLARWGVVFRDPHRARGAGAAVARRAAGPALAGGLRRDPGRPVRRRVPRRAVRASGSGRRVARGPARQQGAARGGRAVAAGGGRSAEPARHHRPGAAGERALRRHGGAAGAAAGTAPCRRGGAGGPVVHATCAAAGRGGIP